MIIDVQLNSRQYLTTNGQCIKLLGATLPPVDPPSLNDICICDFIKCEYSGLVFGSADPESYKKDYTDILFRRLLPVDTVEIKLLKNMEEIADLNNDDLGTFYDGFPGGNDEQQLYVGYLLDWSAVLAAHGGGYYNIKANLNIAGTTFSVESSAFRLLPYSDIAADQTVKIESTQNGNIIGSQFDFTGLNWKQYLRIPGVLENASPEFENDRYVDTNQKYKQIKSTMSRNWTLRTKLINWEVAEKLIYNKLLANEILITDYSILAESIWRDISVRLTQVEKPETFNSPLRRYIFNFVDNQKIYQKRNF